MSKEPKVRVELEPGEEPRATWVAAFPFKRFDLAKEGGTLILTDRRLLLTSLTIPFAAADTIMVSRSHVMWSAPLSEIRSVKPVEGKRAQLQVDTAKGESKRFMLSHRRRSTIWSKENPPARDRAVEQINAATAGLDEREAS